MFGTPMSNYCNCFTIIAILQMGFPMRVKLLVSLHATYTSINDTGSRTRKFVNKKSTPKSTDEYLEYFYKKFKLLVDLDFFGCSSRKGNFL